MSLCREARGHDLEVRSNKAGDCHCPCNDGKPEPGPGCSVWRYSYFSVCLRQTDSEDTGLSCGGVVWAVCVQVCWQASVVWDLMFTP